MSKEEEMLEYCRDRLECYITLEKIYGHERACKIGKIDEEKTVKTEEEKEIVRFNLKTFSYYNRESGSSRPFSN